MDKPTDADEQKPETCFRPECGHTRDDHRHGKCGALNYPPTVKFGTGTRANICECPSFLRV